MKTEVFKTGVDDAALAKAAAEVIKAGGLVAIPTETVYGLAASALDTAAVARIFEVKGRPQDNPLIIHVSGADEIARWCVNVPDEAYALAERFWPGPLTMVLPNGEKIPQSVCAGLPSVAVRCPESRITREIIAEAGVPLAAPSANLSGKPSTTSAEHVIADLDGKIEMIVDDGPCRIGLESTIIDLTLTPPRILRPGGITPEQLEEVLGKVELDKAVYSLLSAEEKPRAPGMKYRHYAPKAAVTIVKGESAAAAEYINARTDEKTAVLCFTGEGRLFTAGTVLEYGGEEDGPALAGNLFAALRKLDTPEIGRIYARCPQGQGVALAVRNRLQKAAAYDIVSV